MGLTIIPTDRRIGFVILLAAVALALWSAERWTTPADELRTVLGLAKAASEYESGYRLRHGSYAPLGPLSNDDSRPAPYETPPGCEKGYCLMIEANTDSYVLQITPQRGRGKMISLYSNETGVVRIAYGSPVASVQSPVLSDESLRRFTP